MSQARTPQQAASDRLADTSLADLEAIRLLLQGSSVIDWHRLAFTDQAQVDRFLRVQEFDPARPDDLERLDDLRSESVDYLTRNFGYRIPDEVADMPVRELFLLASSRGRGQGYACIILKAMHVIHHLAGRELLFKLPISDDRVFGLVESKVVQVVEQLRAAGCAIVEFAWSRKERDAVVTKLLAKKTSIAANVFDKLRFRLVTRSPEDLAPVLTELVHRLVPFNYVIPGESVNRLLHFRQMVEGTPAFARFADQLAEPLDYEETNGGPDNEFSGPSCRRGGGGGELPVRVDQALVESVGNVRELGPILFALTEFQIVDADTAQRNEAGENSHKAYKGRQKQSVRTRLSGSTGPAPIVDDD